MCLYNSIEMDILYNNNLINQIVDKLFKHRRTDYSEFMLENFTYNAEIQHQVHRVANQNYEKLYASIFKKTQQPDICIIFLHGYGSNRLECSNILKVLPPNYALCAFDFSGSGKSEGDLITYGMKEKEDVNSIISYLRQKDYSRFILWGRSMGATSALLYCLKYSPPDVILQIIDSPFYSFEMIAFQIASKNVKAPEFIISFALQMAKKNCNKFQYNPFQIELKNVGDCVVPALFLYCEGDNVINCQNTHLICSKYKAIFEKLVIEENHNTVRSHQTLSKIFAFIEKYSKKSKTKSIQNYNSAYMDCKSSNRYESTPKKAMSSRGDRSFENSVDQKNIRKGIQRVNVENNKRFDDYGIWVASRFKEETAKTPQPFLSKRHSASLKKPHISLSSSLARNTNQFQGVTSPTNFSRQPSFISQFNSKTMTSFKGKQPKKMSTMKSFGSNLYLNNSKYL